MSEAINRETQTLFRQEVIRVTSETASARVGAR